MGRPWTSVGPGSSYSTPSWPPTPRPWSLPSPSRSTVLDGLLFHGQNFGLRLLQERNRPERVEDGPFVSQRPQGSDLSSPTAPVPRDERGGGW